MKVRYTKSFEKAVDKLSGKQLKSVLDVIKEVKEAQRFQFLVSRGQAYTKKIEKELKRIDS